MNKIPNDDDRSGVPEENPAENPEDNQPKPSEWDPSVLRASPNFQLNVADEIPSIACTRPKKHWWVRAIDDPKLRYDFNLLDFRSGGQHDGLYLVTPNLVKALEQHASIYTLVPAVTKDAMPFLWPLRIPTGDAGQTWHQSGLEICAEATKSWTIVLANRQASRYYARIDVDDKTPPRFPDWNLATWLEKAFKDFKIDSLDHPVAQHLLRGRLLEVT